MAASRNRHPARHLLVSSVLLPLLAGCSADSRSPGGSAPTAPTSGLAAQGSDELDLGAADLAAEASASAAGGGYYPLTLGSQWRYDYTATSQLFPTNGPPGTPETLEWQVTHDLIITEELFGRTYVVELQRTEVEGQAPYLSYVRYRQDREGLYEADVPTSDPPGPGGGSAAAGPTPAWSRVAAGVREASAQRAVLRAIDRIEARRALLWDARGGRGLAPLARPDGGVLPGELLRLDYRLRPGSSWTIRPDPLFTSTVEARERISLPIGEERAFRIRVDSELFGPNDRVLTWYNTDGLLRITAHFEEEATDDQGTVIGTLIGEDVKEVSSVNIAR